MDTNFWVIFSIAIAFVCYIAGAKRGWEVGFDTARERWERKWVDDGFGTLYPPCAKCGTKLTIVRPGKAVCSNCEDEAYEMI